MNVSVRVSGQCAHDFGGEPVYARMGKTVCACVVVSSARTVCVSECVSMYVHVPVCSQNGLTTIWFYSCTGILESVGRI